MTALPQPSSARLATPPALLGPLKQVARRRWNVVAARGVALTLLASSAVLLTAVLVLGRLPYLPYAGRVTAAVLVWGSVLVAAVCFLRPAVRRRSLVQTAMDVERDLAARRVDTHERISSALELSREVDPRFAGSPALVQHLIRQAEADAAVIVPERVVSAKPASRAAWLLVPMLAAWVFLAFYLPPTRFLRPLFNLLMPWQETPAFLSDLVVQPGNVTVGQGERLEISVRATPQALADKTRPVNRAVIETRDPASGQVTTTPLGRVGPRDFRFVQESARRSFAYRARADAGESPWYTATVEPVPAVEAVVVRYDFPAYTRLPARTDTNRDDGAVDAVRNTKVTLGVRTTNNLVPASRIVVTEKPPAAATPERHELPPTRHELPLTKAADGLYEASLVLTESGSYTVELTNGHNRPNRERQDRSIIVRPDERPQVTLASPSAELTVGPGEVVPLTFRAADDFGLATVELMAQVDDGPVTASPVALADQKPRSADGRHVLSVRDVLADATAKASEAGGAGNPAEPRRISYWLRATDNRDPDPQSAESTRQALVLDRNAESLAARQDRQAAKDFAEAIRIAIRRLEDVHPHVERLRHAGDERRAPNSEERRRAEESKEKLEKAATDLVKEADDHAVGPYAAMAAAASRTSEKRIAVAADRMAKFDLHADQSALRKEDATTAGKEVLAGKKELEDLLKKVEEQAKLVEAQRKLEELARKQDEMARQMQQAQAEKNKPEPNHQQNALKDQTQQVVNQTPPLQDKKAQAQAQALNELLNNVQEIQKQQDKAIEQNQKQAEVARAAELAKAIAERQAALNKQVEQFRQDEKKPLELAGTQAPEQHQLRNIVRDLDAAKIQQAVDQQKQAAQRLEENAKQLDQQVKSNEPRLSAERQKAADQARSDAEAAEQMVEQARNQQNPAKDAQQQAAAAAKRAAEAKNPDEQRNAAQQAAESAKNAARLAEQAQKTADEVRKKAEAGQKSDDAAMKDAAKRAGEQASEATKSAAAAKAAAEQADEQAKQAAKAQEAKQKDAAQQAARQAGEKAAEAGRKAQQAADQAAAAAQQMADARKQAADRTRDKARQEAKANARAAADEAQQLSEAQRALAEESAAQAQAVSRAQQQGAQPPRQAAEQQQQVAQQVQKAAQKARQLEQLAEAANNPNLSKRAEAARRQLKQAEVAQQQAAEAQRSSQNEQAAGAQEAAQNALARAEQSLRGQTPQEKLPAQATGEQAAGEEAAGEQAAGEAAAAGEMAAGEAAEEPPAGESPAGESAEASGKPKSGQPKSSQAKSGQPKSGQPGPQQVAAAEPHPGESGMAGAPPARGEPPVSPQQAMQQAAQAAAEATHAQQQAAQGNQAAAQQAAAALAKAAEALAQATGQATTPGKGQGQAQGRQPAQGEQGAESAVAGDAGDPKKGMVAGAAGAATGTPPAVAELGITPSDWAKLGPLEQRELLNAAQQAGPPEYQAMIKNYYVRLSRMQADPAGK